MKLIGLLGGVTWESSKEYYRILNEEVKARLYKSSNSGTELLDLYSNDVF